jgi:hypothetical protein
MSLSCPEEMAKKINLSWRMASCLMTHQVIILESKIQDTITTGLGYLRLKMRSVNIKYGRIQHRCGKGSVICWQLITWGLAK